MIKSLRIKFTVIAMSSMFVVLAVMMSGLNIVNYLDLVKEADRLLTMIEENDGTFPEPPSEKENDGALPEPPSEKERAADTESRPSSEPESAPPPPHMDASERASEEAQYSTRFFTVWLGQEGEITKMHLDHIASIDETEAAEYVGDIAGSKSTGGFKDVYRYRKVMTESGSMIIFLNRQNELATFQNILLTSITASFAGLLAVFVLVVIFSRIVFRPVQESYQKQKRFITDASHEIKTPLTIIDANIEVIEMLYEENEWTKSIRNQIRRLTSLTKHLVMLSKLEESEAPAEKERFSMSELVEESVQSFSAPALTAGKKLDTEIEKDLEYTGDEKAISQLVGLLLDNAVKYASEKSTIYISLKRQKKKIRFEIRNEAENLQKGNLNVLFERFYRTDSSRNSKTGGSGIGLSVAHAIVETHKGQITAESPDGKTLSIVVKL